MPMTVNSSSESIRSLDPLIEILRNARLASGMSQLQVAKRAGMGQPQLCMAEAGQNGVTLRTLHRWASVFGYQVRLVSIDK
jgi:transcriptional regulator with XRE-family HTH domain